MAFFFFYHRMDKKDKKPGHVLVRGEGEKKYKVYKRVVEHHPAHGKHVKLHGGHVALKDIKGKYRYVEPPLL